MIAYDTISPGDELPELVTDEISRTTLALYAGASGDHNPIHIDIDFAKSAGMDDVFAHGMLSMAYLGRLLTGWVPQSAIKDFEVKFTSITQVNSKIICSGKVEEKFERDGKKILKLSVDAKDENGNIKIIGCAEIEFD